MDEHGAGEGEEPPDDGVEPPDAGEQPDPPLEDDEWVDPAPPDTDACPNLDGEQAYVPEGHHVDTWGDCVEPPDMAAGDGIDEVEDGALPPADCDEETCDVGADEGAVDAASDAAVGADGAVDAPTVTAFDHAEPPPPVRTAVAGVSDPPQLAAGIVAPAPPPDPAAGTMLPFTGGGELGLLLALAVTLVLTGVRMVRRSYGVSGTSRIQRVS